MNKKISHLNIEQEQRFKELKEEREIHDAVRDLKRQKFLGLIDLNLRIQQYITMENLSLERLIIQTLKDFSNEITVLQTVKIDPKKPVVLFEQKPIFLDPFVNRDDFKKGGVELFTFENKSLILKSK